MVIKYEFLKPFGGNYNFIQNFHANAKSTTSFPILEDNNDHSKELGSWGDYAEDVEAIKDLIYSCMYAGI